MSIIVPAYREAAYIRDMVRQLAVLDYPTNRLDCIIACDGCPIAHHKSRSKRWRPSRMRRCAFSISPRIAARSPCSTT